MVFDAVAVELLDCVADASPDRLGNKAAPVIRACASACVIRSAAAAISRLTVCASSISAVISREPKPRHQSSFGGASVRLPPGA